MRAAEEFLLFINDVRVVTLGMLADAGDETIQLVRYGDSEEMDAADCNSECLRYVKCIHVLFVLGECVRTGYTKFAFDVLRRPKAFVVRGTARTLGSKDSQPRSVIDAALKHMQCWTRLAIQTLRAEHPDFELVAAFQVLQINSR